MTETIRHPFPYKDRGTIIEHWLYRDRTRKQEPNARVEEHQMK